MEAQEQEKAYRGKNKNNKYVNIKTKKIMNVFILNDTTKQKNM